MTVPEVDDIRVVAGSPTPEELAALTAVITSLAEELGSRPKRRQARRSTAWDAMRRPIRTPIIAGVTAWRGFSG